MSVGGMWDLWVWSSTKGLELESYMFLGLVIKAQAVPEPVHGGWNSSGGRVEMPACLASSGCVDSETDIC